MSTDLERLVDAKRHLFGHIIASAHLLDTPLTNAPDQSPWSRMKHAMEGLDAAVKALGATPSTYTLPAEPPPEVTELWDRHGRRWERQEVLGHVRWRRRFSDGSLIIRTWPELLPYGPLSTTPPAGTEGER